MMENEQKKRGEDSSFPIPLLNPMLRTACWIAARILSLCLALFLAIVWYGFNVPTGYCQEDKTCSSDVVQPILNACLLGYLAGLIPEMIKDCCTNKRDEEEVIEEK